MNVESRLNKLEKKTNLSKVPEILPPEYTGLLVVVCKDGEDGELKLKEAQHSRIDDISKRFKISYEEAERLYKKQIGLNVIVNPQRKDLKWI